MAQLPALVATQYRGDTIESVHPVAAVLCRADGTVVARTPDPVETTWRSAAKPFQLIGSLSFLPEHIRASITDKDLAIGAASHSGQPKHIEQVESLMARLGVDASGLQCGAHWPVHDDSGRALVTQGQSARPIHNNCSGKHSFMLAAAAHGGFALDYRPPEHPVQEHIRRLLDELTGGTVTDAVIDGCGVPCFVLTLKGMAQAWANLAAAMTSEQEPASSIGWAMHHHVDLVSGCDRLDQWVVKHSTEPVVAKVGAQGLQCFAFPNRGLGLAIKVLSGVGDMRAAAVRTFFNRTLPGLIPDDIISPWDVVHNCVGHRVGHRAAHFSDSD